MAVIKIKKQKTHQEKNKIDIYCIKENNQEIIKK